MNKKWLFCLSLWYFHVCMHYNPIWLISSSFLLSTFVSFL
jgi:hypothetical protein